MTNNLFLIAYALINLLDPSHDVDPGESWFELAISLSMLAGLAGVFAKAGRPWYAALVPIYAELTLLRIMEKPW